MNQSLIEVTAPEFHFYPRAWDSAWLPRTELWGQGKQCSPSVSFPGALPWLLGPCGGLACSLAGGFASAGILVSWFSNVMIQHSRQKQRFHENFQQHELFRFHPGLSLNPHQLPFPNRKFYHLLVFPLMIPGTLSSSRILSAANSYCKGISFEPLLTPDRSRHLQGEKYVLTYFQSVFSLTCRKKLYVTNWACPRHPVFTFDVLNMCFRAIH